MKYKFLFFIAATIAFLGCRQERLATKTAEKSIFSQQRSTQPFFFMGLPNFADSHSGLMAAKENPLQELQSNGIPLNLPNNDFPNWESFYTLFKSKEADLSLDARLRSAVILLRSYNFSTVSSSKAKAAVTDCMDLLTKNNYSNYEVVFDYLVWMKKKDAAAFNQTKARVLEYAKPLLPDANPKQKDSPLFDENPELKKQMEGIIKAAERNDSYIEKIRTL